MSHMQYKVRHGDVEMIVVESVRSIEEVSEPPQFQLWTIREYFLGTLSVKKDPARCTVIRLRAGTKVGEDPFGVTGITITQAKELLEYELLRRIELPDGATDRELPSPPAGVGATVAELKEKENVMVLRLSELSDHISEASQRLASLNDATAAVDADIAARRSDFELQASGLQGQLAELGANVQMMTNIITKHKETIRTLEASITEKSEASTAAHERLALALTAEGAPKTLAETLAAVRGARDALSAATEELGRKRIEIAEVDRLLKRRRERVES